MIRLLLIVLFVIGAWYTASSVSQMNVSAAEESAMVTRLDAGIDVALDAAKLNTEQTGSPERDTPGGLASHTPGAVLQAPSGAPQRFPGRVMLDLECEPSQVLPPDFLFEVHACSMSGSSCDPAPGDQDSLGAAPRWLRLTYTTPAICGPRGRFAKQDTKKVLLERLLAQRLRRGASNQDVVLAPDKAGLWLRLQ